MFCNWGAVLGSQYLWGVSSSADTTGEAFGISPWLGHEKWLNVSWEKKKFCVAHEAVIEPLQWIQSSFTWHFFWTAQQSHEAWGRVTVPILKRGETETHEVDCMSTLESQGWKGCWGASLSSWERHSWVRSVFFPCSFSSSLLNPLLLFFSEVKFIAV